MRSLSRSTLVVSLATIALVVAACGGASSPSPSAPATSAPATSAPATSAPATSGPGGYTGPPVTIEYAIWGNPEELAAQSALLDKFRAANPNITVKVTVSDWTAYWEKLLTGIAGGAAPDVFAMDGPIGPDYQERDVLLDLTPLIAADGYDLGQMDDNAVKQFTTSDGKVYGLPRAMYTVVMFYNKDMFDAASLPYPDASWDWDKLVEVGQKLTLDKDGNGSVDQWGLYTETTDMENAWSSFVWQAGGDILNADGTATALDKPESAAGIQFLQDLIWKHKIAAEPAVFAETGNAFEQGLAAMEINGSWLKLTHEAAGINFGIAHLPKGPAGPATSVNGSGDVISKTTKSPEAAWELVKYLSSEAAQQDIMAFSVPVNKKVLATVYASSFEGAQVIADSLAYAHLKPTFKGYTEFTTILQDELNENVFNAPNKTAADAIASVNDKLNKILKANQ